MNLFNSNRKQKDKADRQRPERESWNSEQWFQEGLKCGNSGDYHQALECFQRVTEMEPTSYSAWLNLGITYEGFGEISRAIQCYERVVWIKPNFVQAISNLAKLYFQTQQFHKAKYWIRKEYDTTQKPALLQGYSYCLANAADHNSLFISHSWQNRDFVDRVLQPLLDSQNFEYFVDRDKLPQQGEMGELPWQIEQAIAQCDTMILVWSEKTPLSRWVQSELCTAVSMLKNIIPVSLDNTPLPTVIQTAMENGKISSYHWGSSPREDKFITMLKRSSSLAEQIDHENSFVRTTNTYWEEIKFEWVKLTGGILPDFYVGRYPVTQGQWEAVMGDNPSEYKGDNTRPVENVTWYEVQEFIRRLNSQGNISCRLLSDIEWEFACRAGSLGNWCFGDDEDTLFEYAWMCDNAGQGDVPGVRMGYGHETGRPSRLLTIETSPHFTNSVFSKKPNKWGIYHLHGNVWEWCKDEINDNQEKERLVRGGSFRSFGRSMRCSNRGSNAPDKKGDDLGFRLRMEVKD